jgi:4'-phosphopantetheinyl transferase
MPLNCVWLPQLSDLKLADDEVHLWRAWLEQPTICLRLLYRLLSVDERHRAGRFRFDLDRNRFIARRGLLRVILGRYLDLKPASIRFGYGPNGKPFLEDACDRDELTFNLSHSKELAIYAISRKRKIGVDVERIRSIPEADKIVRDVFASREPHHGQHEEPRPRLTHKCQGLRTATRRQRFIFPMRGAKAIETFFEWWTRTEAYVKASGDGLGGRTDSTNDSVLEKPPSRSIAPGRASAETIDWSWQTFTPVPGHIATIVVEGTDWRLSCCEWREDGELRPALGCNRRDKSVAPDLDACEELIG